MFEANQYELIDFGDGIKVERFGNRVIARETPSVDMYEPRLDIASVEVDASFDSRDEAACHWHGDLGSDWLVEHKGCKMLLRQTPTGQVGVFPEQAQNWDWIAQHEKKIAGKKAINLFAYTGGSSLALASAGAHVTHVDSASSVVSWARQNAVASGLGDHPIRWIVEDAMKFVQREVRRGNKYDIFVADPPSFGRGGKNRTWKIERDLEELIQCASLLCPQPTMLILSFHTLSYDAFDLKQLIVEKFESQGVNVEALSLSLACQDGRTLPSGECARFVESC